jgi:predicted neutral ceramidase superfamily lipid hydrolase
VAKEKRQRIVSNKKGKKGKTVLRVTLLQLTCLLVFLLFLGLANLVNVDNPTYPQVIQFLNENVGTIIIFAFLFYLGELFFVFRFPFNLPAPILNAFGGIFLIEFLFRIFYMIGEIVAGGAFFTFKPLELCIFILVFLVVIVLGYVKIFKYENLEKQVLGNKDIERKESKKEQKKK